MSRNAPALDTDALLRSMNPSCEPPSSDALGAALQRLLAEADTARTPAARWRRPVSSPRHTRIALATGLLVVVIAAAFAMINQLAASSRSAGVGTVLAKDVIARTADAAAGTRNGVLHIDMRVTQTSAGTAGAVHYRVQSWTQLGAPHAHWETIYSGSDFSTTVLMGGRFEYYDSRSNTISGGAKQIAGGGPRAALLDPAYHAVLAALYPGNAPVRRLPATFAQLMVRLIRSPHVTVDRHATLDGRPALRITALDGRAIIYARPDSYTPLEFVSAGDPGTRRGSIARITMRFVAYGTLPHRSVSPPDLHKLHPRARLSS